MRKLIVAAIAAVAFLLPAGALAGNSTVDARGGYGDWPVSKIDRGGYGEWPV